MSKDKPDRVFYGLAAKLLDVIYKVIKKDVDVPYLQKKYKATRGMVLEIHITHTPVPTNPPVMEIHKFFKIADGTAVMMDEAEANATMWCELNTMLNMIKGEVTREYRDSKTGKARRWIERYTPLDAWAEGKLTVTSPGKTESGWLSDLELFSKDIYSQVFPIIKEKIGKSLP
jgi:hypothetical protein